MNYDSIVKDAFRNAVLSFYKYPDSSDPLKIWESVDQTAGFLSSLTLGIIKDLANYLRYEICKSWDEYLAYIAPNLERLEERSNIKYGKIMQTLDSNEYRN